MNEKLREYLRSVVLLAIAGGVGGSLGPYLLSILYAAGIIVIVLFLTFLLFATLSALGLGIYDEWPNIKRWIHEKTQEDK